MKKNSKIRSSSKKLSRKNVALLVSGAYILFLALGVTIIFFLPYFLNRNTLLQLADSKGQYTISYYTNPPQTTTQTEFYLFTDYGALVTSDQSHPESLGLSGLRELCPELLDKSSIYRIIMLKNESGSRLVILAGRTTNALSGKVFLSFIVRNLSDMSITLSVFAAVFTFLFLISIFIIIFIMKQHDDFMKLQRDLVSNVSHELKTPITSIKAVAELLYDGMYRSEDERKRYAQTILHESDRLNDLVREILNLSRLQSNREKFEKHVLYADGVFTPVIDRYRMMCEDMGINIDVSELALEAIPALYSDPHQLPRVWMIILDNAMKFAGEGGHIKITQKLGNDHVTFCISDDGPGISRKDINRIFDRFYKADLTRNSQGSGLGLSIANEIMRGLKEKLWVESVEGEGSSFFFTVSYK